MSTPPKDPELLEIPGAEGLSVDFFTNLMNKSAPTKDIPLLQTAGMSGAEQTVQGLLKSFLGTSATEGEAYGLGMGELKKTLGGEFYDPKTSDFWKGYRETSEMEQEKGVAGVRRRSQLGGRLYSTPSERTEAEYVKGMGAERTKMLGGLYERERDRKTAGIGQALGFAGFEEAGKLGRLKAGSEIGALPRLLKGEKYKAEYTQKLGQEEADYASSMAEIGIQSGAASTLMPQWYIDQSQQSDPLGGILGILGSIISK